MVPAEPALGVCGVCAGPMGEAFIAREQHLGLGDAFRYAACSDCGTVQLIDPPASFHRYYPCLLITSAASDDKKLGALRVSLIPQETNTTV